ncbi:MAG: DEAD/DEAH box helicase [Acidobacteriota bacterium]
MSELFKLDFFQEKAIQLIEAGNSVIVSAPTGAGKTLIAEHIMRKSLLENKRIIYTSPVKALSNQKFRDFSKEFKDKTGIVTGDVSINPDAPLLIMTTEILRNRLYRKSIPDGEYSWIIFDEIHYIDDPDRGTVWEESLMFLPEGTNFLGLSATLPNLNELSAWIRTLHKNKIETVIENSRPVPLKFYYIRRGKTFNSIDSLFAGKPERYRNKYDNAPFLRKKLPSDRDIFSLVQSLQSQSRLPAIYFTLNRKRTSKLASAISTLNFLNEKERLSAKDLIDRFSKKGNLTENPGYVEIVPTLRKGIAYHHAGMLPSVKELVEQLFTMGLIKVVFATATFALGINMPAKTVIFDEIKKRSGRSFRIISKRDFFQMAGRAGRRGIDTVGYVYSFVDQSIQYHSAKSLTEGDFEPVRSRFALSYAGILNLYEEYGEDILDIYSKTFKYFTEKMEEGTFKAGRLKNKIKVLKDLKYIEKGKVSKIGSIAREIHGYELPMGEFLNKRLLEKLYPKDLVYITLALVYEPRKDDIKSPSHGRSKYLYKLLNPLISRIHKIEKNNKVSSFSPSLNFKLSSAAELWMKGEPFYWSVYMAEIDEGDLIRYFRMSIQILRELIKLKLSDDLKSKIKKGINLINREIIDAEKELRSENI